MSEKRKITLSDLEKRKKRIESELSQAQNDLDDSLVKARSTIISSLNPIWPIRRNPFKSVGMALAAGFIFGWVGKKDKKGGKKSHDPDTSSGNGLQKPGFGGLIFEELKHIAAQRAVQQIMRVVDARVSLRDEEGDLAGKETE